MCFSKNNNQKQDAIAKATGIKKKYDDYYDKGTFMSGFNHPKLLMVIQEKPDEFVVGNWGLVPSFINDSNKAKEYLVNTLNAKSETIFEKVSFKNSIMPRRCIIPIQGFYEWRDINKAKYPYFIQTNEPVMLLGGIYDYWTNRSNGEIHRTYSVITTDANLLMAKIHNLKKRQPLILRSENASDWLNPNLKENDVIELMQPLPENLINAHTIKKINPKAIDVLSEEITLEFEYPEVTFLDSMY